MVYKKASFRVCVLSSTEEDAGYVSHAYCVVMEALSRLQIDVTDKCELAYKRMELSESLLQCRLISIISMYFLMVIPGTFPHSLTTSPVRSLTVA